MNLNKKIIEYQGGHINMQNNLFKYMQSISWIWWIKVYAAMDLSAE